MRDHWSSGSVQELLELVVSSQQLFEAYFSVCTRLSLTDVQLPVENPQGHLRLQRRPINLTRSYIIVLHFC